jgi:hypothetical protein
MSRLQEIVLALLSAVVVLGAVAFGMLRIYTEF